MASKKNNKNWFNEYQKVENYLIEKLGYEDYVKLDFSKLDKCSEVTILIIDELLKKLTEAEPH